jgi:hypothetical protein
MVASEAALIAFSVGFDVLSVFLLQLLHVLHDDGEAAAGPRALGADVGVAASAVPISRHRLGIETGKM